MNPDIYLFNPTCELAVSNGSANYMAPVQLRNFEKELSSLPWILAQPEDIVLTDQPPDQHFTDLLKSTGFILPEFRSILNSFSNPDFLSCKKGFLFPWGWSPSVHKLLSPLKPGCCPEFLNSPVAEWRDIHRELFSRKASLGILEGILKADISDHLLSINHLPEICIDHEQIIALQHRWGKVVVKSPLSASGRGLQVLRSGEYNRTNRQVIAGFFRQQGYAICEPWHNRVLDLSFQFFSNGNGTIDYKGVTTFSTDQAGRYTGNFIQELPPAILPELKDFLIENKSSVKETLLKQLTLSNYSTDYYGWLGVDALILKKSDGKLNFHPCLEINCRFTMGAVALSLRKQLAPGSAGVFRIMNGSAGNFAKFCEEMINKESIVSQNGKIVSGFIPLTPATANGCSGAYMRVSGS